MTDKSTDIQNYFHVLKQRFCADLPARLEKIHIAGYNWLDTAPQVTLNSDFQMLVHDLAGSAGSYGFPKITRLCQQIEDAILENNHTSRELIPAWLDQLLATIKE